MGHCRIILILALAGCQTSPPAPNNPCLKTKLTVLDAEVVLGKTLRIRLELTNESSATMAYDDQGIGRGTIEIKDASGAEVPYIDISRQTFGHTKILKPGETAVLMEDDDLAPYYQLTKPGRHSLRYAGGGLQIIDVRDVPALDPTKETGDADRWSRDMDKMMRSPILVPSNVVTVEIKPGTPEKRAVFAAALMKILPPEWDLGVALIADRDEGIWLTRHATLKSDVARIEVSHFKPAGNEKPLGRWNGREVYAIANAQATALWPDFRTRIASILDR
jgi:hypothetical protein